MRETPYITWLNKNVLNLSAKFLTISKRKNIQIVIINKSQARFPPENGLDIYNQQYVQKCLLIPFDFVPVGLRSLLILVGTGLVVLRADEGVRQVLLVTDDTRETRSFYASLSFREFGELGLCGFMKAR